MSLTIWQTLGNTFYQGDDSRSIRTNGAAGNSDLDLIAPMGFGGNGGGASGFTPTPGSVPLKPQPLNLRPKGSNSAGLGAANDISGPFGGLQGGLTRQGPLPRSLSPLPDLSRISPRGVGADPIGKNLPSRRSSQPSQGIRDLAERLQGGKGSSASGKGLPGSPQPKTATAPKRLPFAEPEPAPKGLLGLKPSPRPANQPKTGTPSPKNSLPAQRRDPRTAKPFPGKPENQPLGDRPSKRNNPSDPAFPITGNSIPLPNNGSIYSFEAAVVGVVAGGLIVQDVAVGGAITFDFELYQRDEPSSLGYNVDVYIPTISYVHPLKGRISVGGNTYVFTKHGVLPSGEIGKLNRQETGEPYFPSDHQRDPRPAPPLKSPKKDRPPDFKPIPNGSPAAEPLPPPFLQPQPQPQPFPAPTEKPQQQPKPDADKEPRKSPTARRNPKPAPKPVVKPIPAPYTTGSGNFPKPDSTGTPQGSGSPAGGDYAPTTGATPPSPSPPPNYPDPAPAQSRPLPAPTPAPSKAPLPDFDPITDKTPTPIKEPDPVVQFPPFPVAPKLNSGNACQTADPCTQKISSGVDSANDKADDLGKKVKDIADGLDKALQVLDIGLLTEINGKLGPKVEGGLSGQGKRIFDLVGRVQATASAIGEKLGKFAKWARLGQLVSVLTLITTLHNALMLSRSVGETLLSMLSNGLAVFGIKDDGGNPYELGELIGKSVENMMKETIGTANYTTLSTNFKKANRIYQAAANLGNSIQSMRFSVVSALETIGGWNARIGNALKRSGVVNESSYSWMNPTPNFDNKFTQALERVEDTVSQIDSVASEILSAQETVTQIGTQKTELLNSLGLGTEKPQTENQPQKTAAIAAKAASVSPNIEATDLNKPGV